MEKEERHHMLESDENKDISPQHLTSEDRSDKIPSNSESENSNISVQTPEHPEPISHAGMNLSSVSSHSEEELIQEMEKNSKCLSTETSDSEAVSPISNIKDSTEEDVEEYTMERLNEDCDKSNLQNYCSQSEKGSEEFENEELNESVLSSEMTNDARIMDKDSINYPNVHDSGNIQLNEKLMMEVRGSYDDDDDETDVEDIKAISNLTSCLEEIETSLSALIPSKLRESFTYDADVEGKYLNDYISEPQRNLANEHDATSSNGEILGNASDDKSELVNDESKDEIKDPSIGGNVLDKIKNSHLKRESYFTNLEMINVDNTRMYEGFCIEDDKMGKQLPECETSPTKKLEDLSDKKFEVLDIKDNIPFIELSDESGISQNCEDSNYENLPSNHSSCSFTSFCPSSASEGYSSRENPNYGMILSCESHSTNASNTEQKKNSGNEYNDHDSSLTGEEYSKLSSFGISITEGKPHSVYVHVENEFSDASPPSFSPPSLERKFNDTIEEMELLLKYGVNYFGDKGDSHDSKENEIKTQDHDSCEESIVSPEKEMTISSTNSIRSFNPNFDSTHASTDNVVKEKVTEGEDLEPSEKEIENKSPNPKIQNERIPPPKPPRHVSSVNKECALKLPTSEFASKSGIKGSASTQTTKILRNKTSPIHSAVVKNISVNNMLRVPTSTNPYSQPRKCNNCTPCNKGLQTKPPLNSSKAASPATPNPTSHLPHNIFRTPNRILNCKTPTSLTPVSLHSSSALSKTTRVTRMIPRNYNRPFLTPQGKTSAKVHSTSKPQITITKASCPSQKSRGLSIVSPVAKYLQDNPPPPLIATVKPRFKLSPQRITKEAMSPSPTKVTKSDSGAKPKENMNESSLKREAALKRIDDEMRKLTSKVKSPLKEMNSPAETAVKVQASEDDASVSVLPSSIYLQGTSVHLENKENLSRKRGIPSDRPPASILKHKGRVKMSKETVFQLESGTTTTLFQGPKIPGENVPNIPLPSTPGRVSLMEVSVYEPHSVHHTNTLH